ncbi:MAG: hypothetical protein Q8Q04_00755 [archaeon]|nr:hypothetical protein [archaeon]
MSKRGLSTVITTVLIVLLVLVSIGILWAAISGLIGKGVDSISLGGISVDMKIESATINGSIATVKVLRNPGVSNVNITELKFIVEDSRNSEIFIVEVPGGFPELAKRTYYLDLSESTILDLNDIIKISLAPGYLSGSGAKRFSSVFSYGINGSSGSGSGVTCSVDNDCGTDEWLFGSEICSEDKNQVLRFKKEFTCISGLCEISNTAYNIETCVSPGICYEGSCSSQEIGCSIDSDCGTNGYVGFPECNQNPPPESILQHYRSYSCVNSACEESTSTTPKEICGGGQICESIQGEPICSTQTECTINTDCGNDEWVEGSEICSPDNTQVIQYKKEYGCLAGNCQSSTNPYAIETCEGTETCYEGSCIVQEVRCSIDSDCGTSGYVGFPECNQNPPPESITQNYRTYSCINTLCEESTSEQTIQTCGTGQVCSASQGNPECFTPLECTSNSNCDFGEICIDGSCEPEEAVITGTISSIWPPSLGEYFNSPELPNVPGSTNYVGYKVIFPGSTESKCFSIREYVYPGNPSESAYVRLNSSKTSISSGNNFQVWQTAYGCSLV